MWKDLDSVNEYQYEASTAQLIGQDLNRGNSQWNWSNAMVDHSINGRKLEKNDADGVSYI